MIASNFSLRRQQEVPRVVDVHVHLRIPDDVEVVLAEIRGDRRAARAARSRRSSRCSTFGIDRHRAGRDAGAAADDEHRPRMRRDQRRQVAEHALQAHVLRLARRLHLAGVVIVEHAVRQPRHGDRRVPALADVDDVGLADARRGVAAVADEQPRHGRGRCARAAPRRRPRATSSANCQPRSGADPRRRTTGASISSAASAEMTISNCSRELAAEPGDEHAGAERADDRADGVRGVDAADQPRGILPGRGDRGERQRKARAPENRRRQHGPEAAREIELEVEPDVARDRRVDRPVRQRLGEHVRRPRDRGAEQHLAHAERDARTRDAARERGADAAADAEADQEHRQDQRERVRRRAEEQREQARPDHFGRQRRHAGQRDGEVHRPGVRRARRRSCAAAGCGAYRRRVREQQSRAPRRSTFSAPRRTSRSAMSKTRSR